MNKGQGKNQGQGFEDMPEEEVKEIGRKGGKSQGKDNNPGNITNRDQGGSDDSQTSY